jgi:Acetyltransferases
MQKHCYKTNTATRDEIESLLNNCSHLFDPTLNSVVNIKDYADKIRKYAITIEAWEAGELIGIVACYMNDSSKLESFITNVCVSEKHHGRGIASELLKRTINEAYDKQFTLLKLEVEEQNLSALKIYEKFQFVRSDKIGSKYLMIKTLD